VAAIIIASIILTFIGLGLVLWGTLAFFVRPQQYVKSDLMNVTALSSLETIDDMLVGMGYHERGIYIPMPSDKTVAFIPAEPFSKIPQISTFNNEGGMFLDDPKGIVVVPPGLALATLIQKHLGFRLRNRGVEILLRTLPKVLVEDLEVVRDIEAEMKGNLVKFRLVDSIYADFCRQLRDSSRPCGLGCPMCSAIACLLAIATGKAVIFEQDRELGPDGRTTESNYQLITEPRISKL
jgi:hypothetical protein